ncbi:hypothetical protein AB0C65_38655 [Nocardia sp. NPDC048505]|uniref:hypothetical protein n=1 Tax=Nocardia sp. NPDC048505 TaxID=3155756 RepID=UPI0033F844EC
MNTENDPAPTSDRSRARAMMDMIEIAFPGDGLERPSEEEWLRADMLIGTPIPRTWKRDDWDVAGNRAYLRSRLKRYFVANMPRPTR